MRVQPRVKKRFMTAQFHALAFMRPPIAIEAYLVAGFRHTYGLLALHLGRPLNSRSTRPHTVFLYRTDDTRIAGKRC